MGVVETLKCSPCPSRVETYMQVPRRARGPDALLWLVPLCRLDERFSLPLVVQQLSCLCHSRTATCVWPKFVRQMVGRLGEASRSSSRSLWTGSSAVDDASADVAKALSQVRMNQCTVEPVVQVSVPHNIVFQMFLFFLTNINGYVFYNKVASVFSFSRFLFHLLVFCSFSFSFSSSFCPEGTQQRVQWIRFHVPERDWDAAIWRWMGAEMRIFRREVTVISQRLKEKDLMHSCLVQNSSLKRTRSMNVSVLQSLRLTILRKGSKIKAAAPQILHLVRLCRASNTKASAWPPLLLLLLLLPKLGGSGEAGGRPRALLAVSEHDALPAGTRTVFERALKDHAELYSRQL